VLKHLKKYLQVRFQVLCVLRPQLRSDREVGHSPLIHHLRTGRSQIDNLQFVGCVQILQQPIVVPYWAQRQAARHQYNYNVRM